MANVSDLLKAAFNDAGAKGDSANTPATTSVPQTKMAEVAAASDQKKIEMGGLPSDQTFMNAAVMRNTGSGLESATPVEKDLATLTGDQILSKYGPGVGHGMIMGLQSASDIHQAQTGAQRSLPSAALDFGLGTGAAAITSVGSLGALGLAGVSNKLGMIAADSLQNFNEAVQNQESPALRAHRQAVQDRSTLDYRDNAQDSDGSLLDSLRRVGKDAIDAVKNNAADPMLLADNTANALGSLITAAPIAKGLGAVSESLLPQASRKGIMAAGAMDAALGAVTPARIAAAVGDKLPSAMMTSIGLQEAGGAFQGSASDVAQMSPEDLAKSSPYYRDLISQGYSPDDAKAKVANRAGLLAAAIAGPAGMVTSKLSEHFLEHPFTVENMGHLGSNLLKETAEEGLQGASGQLAQNIGDQQYADPSKDLLDGVGEQVGLGALGGLSSAGVTQAPGTAAHLLGSAAKGVGQAISDRVDQITGANEAQNPSSDANVAAAGSQAAQMAQAPETAHALADAVQKAHAQDASNNIQAPDAQKGDTPAPEPTSHGSAMEALADKITQLGHFNPSEIADAPLTDNVKNEVKGSTDRINFMQNLANVVIKKGMGTEDGASAALHLLDQTRQFNDLLSSDQSALAAIGEEHPANAVVEKFNDLGDAISQNPRVMDALKLAQKITLDQAQAVLKPVTEKSASTPEGQQNIHTAAGIAAIAPDKVPLEVSSSIMEQANKGKVKLTQDQHQALMSSQAIMQAAKNASDAQEKLGHKTPLQSVSDDLLVKPGEKVAPNDEKRSAVDYSTRIFDAMRSGDTERASSELGRLKQVVQLSNNKVQALNTHYAQGGGKPVPYESLNPKTRQTYTENSGMKVNPQNRGQVEFAQRVSLEAQRLSDIYNGVSKAFPALKGGQTEATALHENLQGKPQAVVQTHKEGRASLPSLVQETRAEPAPQVEEKPSEPKAQETRAQETKAEATPAKLAVPQAKASNAKGAEAESSGKVENVEPVNGGDKSIEADTPQTNTEVSAEPKEGTPAPVSVKEAYPNLHGDKFVKAFEIPKKAGSRLFGSTDPIQTIKDALKTAKSFADFTNGERKGMFSKATRAAYQEYLDTGAAIADRLNERLAEKLAQKREKGKYAGKTFADLLDSGEFGAFPEGKVTQIVEKQPDGSFKYNPALLHQAVLAGQQWLLVSDNYRSEMDADLVSALTGIDADKVSTEDVQMLDVGLSPVEAVRSLADKIVDFWGLQKNDNTSKSFTDGIPMSMAAEVLMALSEAKIQDASLLKIQRFAVSKNDIRPLQEGEQTKDRTLLRLVADIDKGTAENPSPLFLEPTAIEEAALTEPKDRDYYGEDIVPVAKTQMRNPMVPLTETQTAMIQRANDIVHTVSETNFNLFKAIGEEGLTRLFGGGDTSKPLNAAHKASLEGQNTTVLSAFRDLAARITRMQAMGGNLSELPIKYAFGVSSVGRLQMLGASNPQASKIVREVILPTWSHLDLGPRGNPEHLDLFNRAIAQALGIKIHAVKDEELNDKLQKRVEQFAGTMEMLGEHLDKGTLDDDFANQLQQDAKAADVELTPNALHALVELTRWQNASEEQQSKFRTGLYIEADGVTNGLVNAMNMLTATPFTGDQIRNLAKGGLFLDGTKTMNDHRAADKVDLYSVGSNKLQSQVKTLFDRSSPDVKEQVGHLFRLMELLVPKVAFDVTSGNLTVDRGLTKNPMTITLYGSGARGIAGNIANLIADNLYERLSNIAQSRKESPDTSASQAMFGDVADHEQRMHDFTESLNALLTQVPSTDKTGVSLSSSGLDALSSMSPTKFVFARGQFAALQENVLHLLVKPMDRAITDAIGPSLRSSAGLLQSATQAQSIVLEHMFKAQVKALMAENEGSFPSENQLRKVLKGLLKIAPLINTGEQQFFPVKTTSSEFAQNLGHGLNEELRTPAEVYGPSNAGVKGLPMLNIGMGDGMMIQHMLNNHASGLPVFDGFNFALDQVKEGSLKANQAVYNSWGGNPLRAVLDSYKTFMGNIDAKTLSEPELLKDLAKAMLPEWERKSATAAQLLSMMQSIQEKLATSAEGVDARHKAIQAHQAHIDQMAGAQSPFLHKGTALSGTPDEIATALNTHMTGKSVSPAKAASIAPVNLAQVVSKVSFTPEQKTVWDHIQKVGALDGYKLVTGTQAEIAAYHAQNGLTLPEQVGTKTQGFINPQSKTIYLMNSSSETLVHEAIHAATFSTILAHYEGQDLGQNKALVKEAVGRLEGLMNQFLELEPFQRPQAFYDAAQAIRDNLSRGDAQGKAKALNEFMAWTLANKDLTEITKGVKVNPLVQMAKDVLDALKRLFWGRSNAKDAPKVGDDVFSNLQFNTAVIAEIQPMIAEVSRDVQLYQNASYGNSDRISELNEKFDRVFSRYLKTNDPVKQINNNQAIQKVVLHSTALATLAQAQGFSMLSQSQQAFQRTVEALSMEMHLDGSSLAGLDALYRHVTKLLTPEMLVDKDDPDAQHAYDVAKMKFDMLMGHAGTRMDEVGRSSLLPVFLGLSLVDEGLRDALRALPLPKTALNQEGTLDARLTNLANAGLDALAKKMAGQGNAKNIQEAIDNLTHSVADRALETDTYADKAFMAPNQAINAANDAFLGWVETLSDKVIQGAKDVQAKTKNPAMKQAARFTQLIASLATEKNAGHAAEGIMAAMDRIQGWSPLREFMSDVIGRTESNAGVMDLIKTARSTVQKIRQQFREHLPSTISNQFSRKLLPSEWSALHIFMGKTDLAAWIGHYSNKDTIKMLSDPSLVKKNARVLEDSIRAQDPAHWNTIQAKAEQLARYMTTGVYGTNLLRNADAIANLLNEKKDAKRASYTVSDTYTQEIDRLVTLYALQNLDPKLQSMVSSLVQKEEKGIDFVLSYLTGQRRTELDKAQGMARFNSYKGYIPSLSQSGVSLVVSKDSNAKKLLEKSYQRVGDYKGSKAEGANANEGYYFAPVSARAAFEQGIMQNVNQTAGGVDLHTGFSEALTAGKITNSGIVDRIAKQLSREGNTKENLLPVFNDRGRVVAFERSIDPSQLVSLNRDTHLAKMLGVWRGRQMEEAVSQKVNDQLVDTLHDQYRADLKASPGNKDLYVDLWNPQTFKNDKITQDAISLWNDQTRGYIRQVFGNQFMVRRSMLNDAFGYRNASVGDAWTGTSRWKPEVQDTVKKLAMSVFGNDAYKLLVNAEGFVQSLVEDAKSLIVVKSVIVPMTNFAANMFQLLGRGVPMGDVVKGVAKFVNEGTIYTKGQLRKIDAEGELRAAEGAKNFNAQHKLRAEIQAIEDGWKRLSIWPLIQAGEFGAITDLGISRDDVLINEGKLQSYMDKLVGMLPESVQNAGRFALISKDMSLFQGLQKSVEYGDFLGKAIYYQHLTQRRGVSSEKALAKVSEEFINFDKLPGRSRGYLEQMGLLWFYNYKLRAAKIAVSMIRDNPVQTLMSSIMPMERFSPVDGGTPLTDNIFSQALNGKLGNSIGPGQLFRSPAMHPLAQLLF